MDKVVRWKPIDDEIVWLEQHIAGDYVSYTDHKQTLAEKDNVIIALQERIAYYDRWLSNGVYYTNDEFLERVLKPRQQLMEKAVMFAERLAAMDKGSEVHWNDVEEFLNPPEVKAWKEQS